MIYHYLSLLEGLDVFAFMTLTALAFGLKMLISVREGESVLSWFWALMFLMTALLADLTYLRLV